MSAQISFEQHFALTARGASGKRETEFANKCGVERRAAKVIYGESFDERFTFEHMRDAGKGLLDARTDFFGTAEVWNIAGRSRLLNVWMLIMDTGYSTNEMFCLDSTGRVTMQETLKAYQPVEKSNGGWIHLQRVSFNEMGREHVEVKTFISRSGHPLASPRLDSDDLGKTLAGADMYFAADIIGKLNRRPR